MDVLCNVTLGLNGNRTLAAWMNIHYFNHRAVIAGVYADNFVTRM